MGTMEGMHMPADAGGTEVLAFARYPDLERAADRTAAKIKEGFMEMGYILKVARDTDILAGSGYASHEEFAERRYGLDKGTVSRYIRIVERFSVGGSSHVLQEGYRNIGFAKLSLMLHMPDAIAEEITESYSKQEVQAIKEEVDAEHAVSDIEVAIEAAEAPGTEKGGSLLERAVRQLGREQQALYHRLHGICTVGCTAPMAMETLAPQGDAVYMVRIPGVGRLMLSFSGTAASVTNVRSGEKERYSQEDVLAAAMGIMHAGPVEGSWQQEYGEPMGPVAESGPGPAADGHGAGAAPARQKEKRKESKVVKAAPPKAPARRAGQAPDRAAAGEAHPEPEEQLAGQMWIADFPEAIPDAHYEEIIEAPPAEAEEGPDGNAEAPEACADGGAGMDMAIMAAGAVGAAADGDAQPCGKEEEAAVDATLRMEELWMEAWGHLDSLRKYFTVWNSREIPLESLEKAYQDAVSLEAGIELLLDMRKEGTDGQEHHAQQG